jgi:feruloyl esterase
MFATMPTVPLAAAALQSASLAASAQCQDIGSLVLPNAMITSVESVPAGPYITQGRGGAQQVGPVLPAHCRVAATLTPASDSNIEMEIWLPTEGWNDKFLAVGNGGWAGSISLSAVANALSEGYAASSNDTGHKGGSGEFALGNTDALIDFGYRSMHEMAVQSKTIIQEFYDQAPSLSYYNGCSTGGRQGLMEAQRYPTDFDAMVVGAPVNNVNHLHVSQTQKFMEILGDESRYIPREKVEMIADAVMNSCDGNDGVVDGIVSNPEMCRFEPASLACSGAGTDMCLTPGQVESLNRAYAPTFTTDGELVYPGHAYGFELGWRMPEVGSTPPTLPTDSFRYLGHQDANWEWQTFDMERDLALVTENASYLESTDPDLSAYKANGGKLIMYHGWNDPGPTPLNTIQYYNQVVDALGPNQDDWMRVFMMPGMGHCRGGVGPDQADFMGALERWVESDLAPDRITASKVTGGQIQMTRPLCAYPNVAQWTGVGSTNDAENFVCGTP